MRTQAVAVCDRSCGGTDQRHSLLGVVVVLVAMLTLTLSPSISRAASEPGVWHVTKPPRAELVDRETAVYLAGDSLVLNAWGSTRVPARFRANGWILSGYEIHSGMEVWELGPRIEPVLDDMPQTVVIALGMNDLVLGTSVREFRRQVRELLDLLGNRRVVWIGLHAPSGLALEGRTRAFNRAIQRQMQRNREYTFGNWSPRYAENPEWIRSDDPTGVHLSDEGSKELVTLMLSRLDSLRISRNPQRP